MAPTRQRILITGASGGLGAEMARQLAALGRDLALCARRTDKLEELRAEILAAHPRRTVAIRAMDVTDDRQVFDGVRALRDELGGLDRVVVNAGLAKGAPLGTGGYEANKQTVMTNVVGALAQTEAAMEVFREQGHGHLVMISSMSAHRGLPRTMTTYAATKAAVAHLVEGLRVELHGKPYAFTVLYPGYIVSGMNDAADKGKPGMVSTEKGVRAMVEAMEQEKAEACVPRLPWAPLSVVMKHAPVPLLRRLV
jgi:short-subunit dehydrogenase